MGPLIHYVPTLFSSLFRLTVYLFLRVIPAGVAKFVLPPLYVSYLLSSWFIYPSDPSTSKTQNGTRDLKDMTKGQEPESHHTSRVSEHPLRTILMSLPTSSRRLRLANLAINTMLALFVAEFVLTPFLDPASNVRFSRVGAIYPDRVKITVRYPLLNDTAGEDVVRVVWREAAATERISWKDGPLLNFQEQSDWVDTVSLDGLWPSTSYEYALATSNRTIVSGPRSFRTFPDPRLATGNHFRFVVSSCMAPNFPYIPFQSRTIKGFDLLARYLSLSVSQSPSPDSTALKGPQLTEENETTVDASMPVAAMAPDAVPPAEFLLFLGDFIYCDVPVYAGDDKEAYRRLYRRNYNSNSFRKVYENLPILHTYDDHEIKNNFAGLGNDSTIPWHNASQAYKLYNADANYDSPQQGQYYYNFRYGDVAFFVMDTRRHRSDPLTEDENTRTMLGDVQLGALYDWLAQVNGTSTFKFLVSSVPFTSLWGHDAVTDSWAGFASEKAALMEALHSVPNVILLSGDRHEFAAVEFNGAGSGANTIREFSTSPMSMFYVPFVRTLRMSSDDVVHRKHLEVNETDTGPEVITTEVDIAKERVIHYIPNGNYKWSAFEIDTRDLEKPTLRLEVVVDGTVRYNYEVVGTPVKLQSSNALGVFVATGIKDIFHRIGIKPSKWF